MQKAKTKDVISLRDKAGMGRENVTSADLKLPFLKICYGSAPLLDQSSPMYNPDAKLARNIKFACEPSPALNSL